MHVAKWLTMAVHKYDVTVYLDHVGSDGDDDNELFTIIDINGNSKNSGKVFTPVNQVLNPQKLMGKNSGAILGDGYIFVHVYEEDTFRDDNIIKWRWTAPKLANVGESQTFSYAFGFGRGNPTTTVGFEGSVNVAVTRLF